MDDKDLEENQEQAKHDEASQKTAHVAGKAAATYFGGGAGGAIYNAASQTKVGQDIEKVAGKTLQHVPGANKAMDKLNDSGALDAADKGLDLAGGGAGNAQGLSKTGNNDTTIPKSAENASTPKQDNNKGKFSGLGFGQDNDNNENNDSTDENESFATKIFNFMLNHKMVFISIMGGFLLILILLVTVIVIVGSLVGTVSDFFSGIVDSVVGFFIKSEQELEQEYYQTLKETQQYYHTTYGICIDVNLITAALTVNTSADAFLDEGKEIITDGEDNPDSEDTDNKEIIDVSYKTMKKQVKLLANMQIINKKYELDSSGSYCDNNTGFYAITEGKKNSSTKELIASHDMNSIQAFFTKKSNEEKNYAYYIYYPPFNSDGTCTYSYAKSMLPSDEKELSIGDLGTKEDSVFYWNLVNSFIPDYYKEYLPNKDDPTYLEQVKKIAEDIYLLYQDIGPSQTCAVSYAGPSSLCPNGVTVEGTGTFALEEYVAGVVSREAYTSEGTEALKAQAVAARTYVLKYTDYCTKPIANSTNAQTFTRDINDRAREATNSTAGEILTYNGEIFSAQYDSFCYEDSDCPDATQNSNGTYSVTYTKLPNGEKHTITLTDSSQYSRITYGQGHAHGMSQLLSYQLAKEGKSYQEILSYFYSNGVEISLVLSPTTTEGAEIIRGPITNYIASITNFNQLIYSQVAKSGVGTREGVVAAATTLVSEFYSQTGYKLPYELIPSGKYSGYGVDPNWGTATGNATYPLNGLDCSGFVSWAIHNGGFAYDVRSAKDWGNAGIKRSWSKGTTDSSARPGDLIYNAPTSDNGTTGHIRMIIGVNNDGYIVAEASSRKNGVRITNISFTSTGNYYLVDMSNYYATATRVTDYPS